MEHSITVVAVLIFLIVGVVGISFSTNSTYFSCSVIPPACYRWRQNLGWAKALVAMPSSPRSDHPRDQQAILEQGTKGKLRWSHCDHHGTHKTWWNLPFHVVHICHPPWHQTHHCKEVCSPHQEETSWEVLWWTCSLTTLSSCCWRHRGGNCLPNNWRCYDDIATTHALRLTIDNDNEPAPENIHASNLHHKLGPNTSLNKDQSWSWNGICSSKTITMQKEKVSFRNNWKPHWNYFSEVFFH